LLKKASSSPTGTIVAKCRADNPLWQEAELLPWALSKQRFDVNVLESNNTSRIDYLDVVKGIRCPTLLITADLAKGAIITAAMAREVTALNSKIRVAHVPGAGHSIRRENYAAYMDAVRAFLKEIYD
jgi:N-formylmaleamate deformylase